MTKLPFMSVVVEYFLPVRVLVAVMLTPGRGTAPDFTCPRMVPPLTSAAGVMRMGDLPERERALLKGTLPGKRPWVVVERLGWLAPSSARPRQTGVATASQNAKLKNSRQSISLTTPGTGDEWVLTNSVELEERLRARPFLPVDRVLLQGAVRRR